uniref:EKC/KEOPS complex subunit TPRKB n=2 Tax=Mastacembelus armatus TaxID=205130 RepID=A0A3Q3KZY0_9TELE
MCRLNAPQAFTSFNLNQLHNDGLAFMAAGTLRKPLHLAEFPVAVLLSLWDVKQLVHVRLPLLPGHSGKQQAGHQKVGAAQSGEDVAFKSLHGRRPHPIMNQTQQLELFPEHRVTQMLFKEVKNAAELRRSAVDGQINGALVNPTMLVSPFQVLVAANKALHLQKIGKMKTRSLYSEIIFNLSPTNNISEAFKRFGISDGDESVMVVLVHSQDESQIVSDIAAKVDGLQVPVAEVSSLSDTAKIKKLYKVTPREEKCGTLEDAVICRMATKDVV